MKIEMKGENQAATNDNYRQDSAAENKGQSAKRSRRHRSEVTAPAGPLNGNVDVLQKRPVGLINFGSSNSR